MGERKRGTSARAGVSGEAQCERPAGCVLDAKEPSWDWRCSGGIGKAGEGEP